MSSEGSRWTTVIPVTAALLLYALLLAAGLGQDDEPLIAVMVAPVMYFTAMYLYYGLTRLAFTNRNLVLWSSAVIAALVSYVLLGGTHTWILLTGWSMILVTAAVAGRLTFGGYRPRTVYIIAVISLVIFGTAQYMALWLELLRSAPENIQTLVAEAKRQLAAVGESEARSRQTAEAFREFATVVFRLAPAVMLLSAVAQFSVGYLLFARWTSMRDTAQPPYEPFRYWKMPYGGIPLVAIVSGIRLLGDESIRIAADNALAFLAVFYCVTGLALTEYFLRKIQFSTFMKVLFYVFLSLLPIVFPLLGIIVGGTIILLGFIDSFADWRRVRLREFV